MAFCIKLTPLVLTPHQGSISMKVTLNYARAVPKTGRGHAKIFAPKKILKMSTPADHRFLKQKTSNFSMHITVNKIWTYSAPFFIASRLTPCKWDYFVWSCNIYLANAKSTGNLNLRWACSVFVKAIINWDPKKLCYLFRVVLFYRSLILLPTMTNLYYKDLDLIFHVFTNSLMLFNHPENASI